MRFLFLITLLSLVEFGGDANFRIYAQKNQIKNLLIGCIFYVLLVKILIKSLKRNNVILTNGMWDGVSALVGTVLAFFILHERVNHWSQWVGIGFIIFGITLLNFNVKSKFCFLL